MYFSKKMEIDKKVFSLIESERSRQINGIELIASENFVSPSVMKAQGSVLTNKYAEGYPSKRYYGGCEVVDVIEQIAIDRAKKIFGAEYANVQPHSGSQANAAVFNAFLNPGDKILGFDLAHGGHLTHGSPVNFSGKLYEAYFYGVDKENGLLDYNEIYELAKKNKPKMIIAGASAYSRDINFKKFREIADEVGSFLLADIAHPSGLIAAGLLNSPIKHCHVVTTTTHKTLRGARGGLILMGKDFENTFELRLKNGNLKKMSNLIDLSVFPGNQGGPLMHIIAAKAISFGEVLTPEFKDYMKKVQINARVMAEEFLKKDYKLISGGTDNHLMLIDLRNKGVSGKDAEETLVKADITLNKNMVPYDDKSPFITSGIRIGTAAITTRGLVDSDMKVIVELIDKTIKHPNNNELIKKVKMDVNSMMSSRELFYF